MNLLSFKTVVVTGGSLGIGFEIAKRCAIEGATVIIAARNTNALGNALAALKQVSNNNHQQYSLDVGKYKEVKRFASWCSSNFSHIYALVNCAGVYGPIGRIDQVSMEKFTEAIKINFLGTVYMCHAFIPLIRSDTRKKIINFSGGGAASPFPNYSAYSTSKIAIVRFTENLSIELSKEGFDINCIAPGFVVTRLHQQTIDAGPELATAQFFENTKKQIESGGIPIEKSADLALFLLSTDSDGITGKFISAPWDAWRDKDFQQKLSVDKDFATLRRIDEKAFFKRN